MSKTEAQGEGILGGPAAENVLIPEKATLKASGAPLSPELSTASSDISTIASTATLRSYSRLARDPDPAVRIASAADSEGKPDNNPQPITKTSKAKASRYFVQPAAGINWGILHASNAVDIANACGTPVVAAAEGIVVDDGDLGSWNGGYGNYIVIEHPNGAKTRYAHLEKVKASIGTVVSQGEQIGTIGNTGKVHGATGCHLHFEVTGMANPFAKR